MQQWHPAKEAAGILGWEGNRSYRLKGPLLYSIFLDGKQYANRLRTRTRMSESSTDDALIWIDRSDQLGNENQVPHDLLAICNHVGIDAIFSQGRGKAMVTPDRFFAGLITCAMFGVFLPTQQDDTMIAWRDSHTISCKEWSELLCIPWRYLCNNIVGGFGLRLFWHRWATLQNRVANSMQYWWDYTRAFGCQNWASSSLIMVQLVVFLMIAHVFTSSLFKWKHCMTLLLLKQVKDSMNRATV